jgi:hypothetical protein
VTVPFWQRMRRHFIETPIGKFMVGDTWDEALGRGLHAETVRMELVRVDQDCWADTRLFSDGRVVTFEIRREKGPYRITRIDIKRE